MTALPAEANSTLHQDVLSDFVLIRTDQIDVGDRLRPIDETWAAALGQMMRRDGQDTPIQVCQLPGRDRWMLVAGGHRLAGAVSAEIEYLRAEVVGAGRDDRRLREVRENLWRSALSPIDRAAFIAEAVSIIKRRAGVDPSADGRAASANARWQKQIATEAEDATATIAVAYGWSDQVGEQIGLSDRTVRNDLMLYRRLAPSLIERLRDARHPILSNSSQLRSLAKLDERAQETVVSLLIVPGASLNYAQPKTIGDAIAHPLGPKPAAAKPDAETKRLSAFIGAFQRMSLAEKRGALAQLAGQLPAGTRIVDGAGSQAVSA